MFYIYNLNAWRAILVFTLNDSRRFVSTIQYASPNSTVLSQIKDYVHLELLSNVFEFLKLPMSKKTERYL